MKQRNGVNIEKSGCFPSFKPVTIVYVVRVRGMTRVCCHGERDDYRVCCHGERDDYRVC